MNHDDDDDNLATIHGAMQALSLSREFLYHLPPGTKGVYRFGRALRFNLVELKEWARTQAAGKANDGR